MGPDPVDEGLVVDRPRVRGAVAQRLAVGLAGSPDVLRGDRRERDKLDGVDLDQAGPDPVPATLLDPWPLPQPDRPRDLAAQDGTAHLAAELHSSDASCLAQDDAHLFLRPCLGSYGRRPIKTIIRLP